MLLLLSFIWQTFWPCLFLRWLQAQYVQLQELYQQLKAQKVSELEGLLQEQVGFTLARLLCQGLH